MNRALPGAAAVAVAAALLAPVAGHAADPARLMAYSGLFQDNYTDTVVKPFQAIGGAVEFVSGDTSAAMLGQLRTQSTSPQLDVVIMDTTTAALACAEGLVEPLTPAMLPVLGQIDPQARAAGGKCGPGVTFDHLVIVYDSQSVTPPPTSLKAMWDPKWKGRIGLDAPPNILGLGLTAILAHAATGDWTKADPAFAELRKLAPSVQTFQPQPDGYSLVLNNTLSFATGWNARAQLYHDRSKGRLGVMLPSEGTIFQINTINLVKGAPHRDEALKFIAYALSAPAQKAFTERMFYGPTNTEGRMISAGRRRADRVPGRQYKAKVIPDRLERRWSSYATPGPSAGSREVIAASGR